MRGASTTATSASQLLTGTRVERLPTLWLLTLCLFASPIAWGGPQGEFDRGKAVALGDAARVEALLQRMHRSLAWVPYEGTIVYLHDRDLSALRVTHRVEDGSPQESLLALTGPIRALSRHWKGVTCMLPDSKPLDVRRPMQGGIQRQAQVGFERIRRFYDARYEGGFRIAGRDTEVVALIPRDDYRYGHRFYIDRSSGLPLKIDLFREDRTPLQQVMFTDIDVHDGAWNGAIPHLRSNTVASQDNFGTATDAEGDEITSSVDEWRLQDLPPGFRVVSRTRAMVGDDNGQGETTRQLMVSDGLASLSIYIAPPLDGALHGESRLGAVNAVGERVGDFQVTVVGEVPLKTVRSILSQSIQRPDRTAGR